MLTCSHSKRQTVAEIEKDKDEEAEGTNWATLPLMLVMYQVREGMLESIHSDALFVIETERCTVQPVSPPGVQRRENAVRRQRSLPIG